jgi:lipopolysaccharide assembly outer membrane protein LptD (OstA)
MLINTFGFAQELPKKKPVIKQKTTVVDSTVIVKLDTLLGQPINLKEVDSVKQDSIPKKKELLEGVVTYKAKDYVSINQRNKKIYLYNEAEVYYKDMEIKAGIIVIDYNTNNIYAGRIKDSSGYSQRPVFKQGKEVIEPDSIIANYKTKKTLIFNSRTQQSDFEVFAPRTKRENDSVIYMQGARLTTSENLEDPEYEIVVEKAKFVPGKKFIAGPAHMEFYGVPTPIYLPFAYFPLSDKRSSGVILPTFGQDTGNDRGYFLQNGGYYFAINDYVDLAVLGDIYSNASYGLRIESNYALRYRFRGNLSFRYENLINSERGFPDFSKSTIYNIRWSHSQDAKANPSSRFSASVNLGSSRFYQQSSNQLNTSNFLNNTLSSSVSYSKTFQGEPQVNVNVTATHSQNTQTQRIDLTLPTLQASVSRMYPFEPKVGTKKGIVQNINFQYNVRGENRIQTTDSLFFKKEMFDDARIGMQHSIPINTNFKLFKYFSFSAGSNFQETWTLNTVDKFFDENTEEVITVDKKGFDSYRTYNFSTSVGTTIYGLFNFKKEGKNPKIEAIRHVMRPSISYNINPAFPQYYETYEVIDADGLTSDVEYSRFEGSLFGAPSNTFSSSVGFSLGNNFEAKVRSKDSTETEPKKIIILNNLNFSSSYNIAGDSLKWSPVRVSGGTQILNNKMNINFSATLDPYALDNNNNKIDVFNIDNGGSLFRLTSASMNASYTLSSDTFSGGTRESESAINESIRSGGRADDLFGVPEDFTDRNLLNKDTKKDKEEKESEFYNFKIPWSLRLAWAVNYTNTQRQNEISSHSLMFSGDIDLSPRWSVGASSGYDFKNQGFTYTQFRFGRDLLSWRMDFSWVPFGDRSSWNFFIGIKSNLLKDLKYDKRKAADQRL